jgi:alpha-L-fucosidase 2
MRIFINTYGILLFRRKLLLFFLTWVISIPVCAQKDIELWYKSPAPEWTDALPIGNGRLGAMVFGNYQLEQIQLNEESIWGGSKINNNNPRARANLAEIQQAVFDGKYQEVWKMSDKYLLGTPPEIRSYQPLGNLYIQYSWNKQPTDYRRSLQLNTGIARTEYTIGDNKVVQEVFASSPQDVIVVNITADRAFDTKLILSRDRDIDTYNKEDGMVSFNGQIHDDDSPKKGPGGKHMRFSSALKIISSDGKVSDVLTDSSTGYKITAAKKVTVILTGASDYNLKMLDCDRTIDPLKICKKILNDASKMTGARLIQIQKQDHRSFFDRVKFTMGNSNQNALPTDERLERVKAGAIDPGLIVLYYQYGRYLLMGSSRKPGRLPANLQGIWNKEYSAKWNSDFHTNINLQMNYWPAETGNLSETSEVLAEFIRQLTVPGGVTAREMYGAQGWTLHHLTDVFGRTGVADGVWGFSPMSGPWMTFPVYRHYEFTGDISYLRELAYPIIKGSVQFVLDFLIESPEGYLVTNPSHSPENPFYVPGTDRKEKAYLSYATTIDIQIIQALFKNYIQAAAILDIDKYLVDKVKDSQKKLPSMKVGANGTLQEWIQDYEEVEPGHRHISHLLGLYPLDLISPEDPVLFEAARKTIERRLANSNRHVGWSSAWIINFYARLFDGNNAGKQVQRLLQYSTLSNLLNTIPPFQIDGNLGGAAGIAEMLLQSQNKIIHLLPALPDTWPDGKIEGLRARGGYTVNMEWKQRMLTKLVIHADKDAICKIRYNDLTNKVSLKKGKNVLSSINKIVN